MSTSLRVLHTGQARLTEMFANDWATILELPPHHLIYWLAKELKGFPPFLYPQKAPSPQNRQLRAKKQCPIMPKHHKNENKPPVSSWGLNCPRNLTPSSCQKQKLTEDFQIPLNKQKDKGEKGYTWFFELIKQLVGKHNRANNIMQEMIEQLFEDNQWIPSQRK